MRVFVMIQTLAFAKATRTCQNKFQKLELKIESSDEDASRCSSTRTKITLAEAVLKQAVSRSDEECPGKDSDSDPALVVQKDSVRQEEILLDPDKREKLTYFSMVLRFGRSDGKPLPVRLLEPIFVSCITVEPLDPPSAPKPQRKICQENGADFDCTYIGSAVCNSLRVVRSTGKFSREETLAHFRELCGLEGGFKNLRYLHPNWIMTPAGGQVNSAK